jgi:hypothetical protein
LVQPDRALANLDVAEVTIAGGLAGDAPRAVERQRRLHSLEDTASIAISSARHDVPTSDGAGAGGWLERHATANTAMAIVVSSTIVVVDNRVIDHRATVARIAESAGAIGGGDAMSPRGGDRATACISVLRRRALDGAVQAAAAGGQTTGARSWRRSI